MATPPGDRHQGKKAAKCFLLQIINVLLYYQKALERHTLGNGELTEIFLKSDLLINLRERECGGRDRRREKISSDFALSREPVFQQTQPNEPPRYPESQQKFFFFFFFVNRNF